MAHRTFTLFHLNLVPVRQMSLLSWEGSREDWLRHTLAKRFEFPHRGGDTLHWVPREPIDECIFGVLEKTRPFEHHEPPERGGGEVVSDAWQGAYVLIDPTTHNEGQRVSVENDVVGTPNAILGSLMAALNRRDDSPYEIEAAPIFDGGRFWAFAKKHGNVLQRITFNFVVPNMWGTESDLDSDLRDTGNQTGAARVKTELSSDDGVTTDNQKVRDGVNYAERGAGEITARSQDGKLFSSTKRPTTSKIPLIQGTKEQIRQAFESLKGKILGHEQDNSADPTDSAGDGALDD